MMSCITTRKLASRVQTLDANPLQFVDPNTNPKVVYSFHNDELNIKTPPYLITAAKNYLEEGKTGYCDAAGVPALRDAIASEMSKARGVTFSGDEVSVQPGGTAVIGKFFETCIESGDEVLYPNPGVSIFENQIKFLGGKAVPYSIKETKDGFALDMESIKRSITPRTRALILNYYQNPCGYACTPEQLKELATICVDNDLWVLSDETHFDFVYDEKPISIVSLEGMKERTVIAYSFSRTFSMSGWRLAAAVGPQRIINVFNKLNVQHEGCTSHFVQYCGVVALSSWLSDVHVNSTRGSLKARRDLMVERFNKLPGFHAVNPAAGFSIMVNVTEIMKKMNITNVEEFRQLLLAHTGVSVSTRNDFGTPIPGEDKAYIRVSFASVDHDQIEAGMDAIKTYIEKVTSAAKPTN